MVSDSSSHTYACWNALMGGTQHAVRVHDEVNRFSSGLAAWSSPAAPPEPVAFPTTPGARETASPEQIPQGRASGCACVCACGRGCGISSSVQDEQSSAGVGYSAVAPGERPQDHTGPAHLWRDHCLTCAGTVSVHAYAERLHCWWVCGCIRPPYGRLVMHALMVPAPSVYSLPPRPADKYILIHGV